MDLEQWFCENRGSDDPVFVFSSSKNFIEGDFKNFLQTFLNLSKVSSDNAAAAFLCLYVGSIKIIREPSFEALISIITGEGGRSPSRFKHVVDTKNGLRRLIPMELERLNMFPDNFTEHEEVTPNKRAFLMGNALVIGVVEKLGESLAKRTKNK